jgi:hypothetical protein
MKYWVYKDSQILGPLAKEDFALAGGVRPETLVCPEGSPGSADLDWRCAEDVGELFSACAASPVPAGGELPPETEFGLMERLQFETLALPGEGDGEGWLEDLFSAPARIPPQDLPKAGESAVEELKSAQKRVGELTSQIEQLSRKLAELEAAPRGAPSPEEDRPPLPQETAVAPLPPAPPPLAAAPAPVQEDEGAPVPPEKPPVLEPLPEVEVPETLKPPEQAGPALGKDESPYRWEDQPPVGGGLPLAGTAPPPAQEPLAPASQPEIPPAPKGRPRRVVKVSAPQSLRKVTRASQPGAPPASKSPAPGASAPAGAPQPAPVIQPPVIPGPALKPAENPYEWGPQPTPDGALPAAGASPLPAPSAPAPAPAPLDLIPPATVVPGAFMPAMTAPPQPVLSPPPAAAPAMGLEAPPVPAFAPPMPTPAAPPPMTMAFSAGSPAEAPAAGPSTAQVLAKLAKPEPEKTSPPKAPPKGRGRTFIIMIAVATVVVAGAGWFLLFRDSSGLQSALQMDSGRPPVGAEVPELPVPAQPQSAPPPAPTEALQAPVEAPPPVEAPRDERPAAIALVKDFPLDGDRGTVGQWLQYSFAASPGAADTEKWDAGAYEETTYAVKYTAQPSGKDAITYLFEADVARKTVKGMNEAARKMLSGGTPVRGRAVARAKPAPAQKRAPPRRAAPPPTPPKEVPLLPLPSDDELAPPADEDNAFRSDTVRTNP